MIDRRLLSLAIAGVIAAAGGVSARAATSVPQVRHLVYTFTWGTSNDTEVQTSGIADTANPHGMSGGASASGTVSSTGGASDHGSISVDVLRQQPDKGLVVSIVEQAVERRSAPAATCVVYGDLTIVCDPNKKVNQEEIALLRFLGSNFVDPDDLDAQRHWQRRQGDDVSDFTIAGNANGIMTINETRVEKKSGVHAETSDITGTIVYDFNRVVPTAVTENATTRSQQGEQYETITTETTLRLVSDSGH